MRKILSQIKQYRTDTILTPIYAMLEVIMEVLLPYIMSKIIDLGIEKNDMKAVGLYGGAMVIAAIYADKKARWKRRIMEVKGNE